MGQPTDRQTRQTKKTRQAGMGGVDNATTYYYGRSILCDTWVKRRGPPLRQHKVHSRERQTVDWGIAGCRYDQDLSRGSIWLLQLLLQLRVDESSSEVRDGECVLL